MRAVHCGEGGVGGEAGKGVAVVGSVLAGSPVPDPGIGVVDSGVWFDGTGTVGGGAAVAGVEVEVVDGSGTAAGGVSGIGHTALCG